MNKYVLGFSLMCLMVFTSTAALAEPMYGVLMVVKGSVKITNASKQTVDGKVGGKVFEGDSIATGADSRAKIVMQDRNVINVNPDTQLAITKYENDAASGKKNVEMNLLQGKVRNNVEQTYDGDKSKFLIKTPTAVAGVRGTQFLAGFDAKTKMTSVVTFKGSVTLATVSPSGAVIGTPVTIKKGEMTQASPDKMPEAPKAVPKEEMKKMDGESTASHQNKDSNGQGEQKRETASDQGDNSGKEKKDSASTDKKEASKDGAKREVASEGPTSGPSANSPGAPPPAMIDSRDMDMGMAKSIQDVRAPTMAPPPPLAAPTPPKIDSSIVNSIIQNNAGKTKVNVKPVLPPN